MKLKLLLAFACFPLFLFSQKDWNFKINTSGLGIYSLAAQFNTPTGETISTAWGYGYKVGGSAIFNKKKFFLTAGLNWKQTFSRFESDEVMTAYREYDEQSRTHRTFGKNVIITDWLNQSYFEVPLGIGVQISEKSNLSAGAILQLQIASCRHRQFNSVPIDYALVLPLDSEANGGFFGAYVQFERLFQIKGNQFAWEVYVQTNYDEIEIPNSTSKSERQAYAGIGLSYFLTKNQKQ